MSKKSLLLGLIFVLLVFTNSLTAQRAGRGSLGFSDTGTISSNIGAEIIDAPDRGALLVSVDSSGRASRFGLQEGDIVLSIDGQEVTDAESFTELMSSVERGAAVSIQVIRDGEETTVGREAITFSGRTEDVEETTAFSSNIGADAVDDPQGALLESVDESRRASRFGLEEGDIVLSINDQEVTDAESFNELVNGIERGAAVSIQVIRDGIETTVGREAMEFDFGGRGGDTDIEGGTRGGIEGTGTRGGFRGVLTVNVLSELLDLARQNRIEELTARLEALLEEAEISASGSTRVGFGGMSSSIGTEGVDSPEGVRLESVDSSGRAYRFGLQEGDVVLSIDGQEVEDTQAFVELMNGVERGAAVSIEVMRDGQRITTGREAVSSRRGNVEAED